MKKLFLSIMMAFMVIMSMSAQTQSNYVGSSKFLDNVSVTVQGGVLTTFDNFFSGHTAMAPIALIGVDKYINPWFGVGVEGRTLVGTGNGRFNLHASSHTPSDNVNASGYLGVNVSGYLKFNVVNMFDFTGTRHFFEPVVYTGLGWGHQTCSSAAPRNYMTYRAGAELNFNLGQTKSWAIVVNPSVVFGDLDNGKLNKHHGNFEVTAGVVYHFKTSNGTTSFAKAKLYDQNEIDELNGKINGLQKQLDDANATIEVLKKAPKQTITETVTKTIWPKVQFKQGSAKIASTSMANIYDIADAIKDTKDTIKVTGYASTEGSTTFNKKLSYARAEAVKKALVDAGVDSTQIVTVGAGATEKFGPDNLELNRIATTEK